MSNARKTIIAIAGGAALLAVAWVINGPLTHMKLERIVEEQIRSLTLLPAADEERITFQDAGGNHFTLKDFSGKPVVMNLWATWCPSCVEEMPVLAELQQRYGDKLQVIAISVDAGGFPQIEKFFAKNAIAHPPIYWDKGMKLFRHLKIMGLPTTFVLNAQGQTIAKMERGIAENDPELLPLLERLTENPPSPQPSP